MTTDPTVTLDLLDAMRLVLHAEQATDEDTLAAMRRAKQACAEAPGYAAPY